MWGRRETLGLKARRTTHDETNAAGVCKMRLLSSSLIASLLMFFLTIENFPHLKSFENNLGQSDGPTDGATDEQTERRTQLLLEIHSHIYRQSVNRRRGGR